MVSRNLPLILLAIGAAVIIYMNVNHSSPCMGSCSHKHAKQTHTHEHHHGNDYAGHHEDPNNDPHTI
jgi:hypothetical protein